MGIYLSSTLIYIWFISNQILLGHELGNEQHNDEFSHSPVVRRYIQQLRAKRNGFFDVEEFGNIIDHYVNLFDLKEASLAIEKGLLQHPRSFDISMRKAHLSLLSGNSDDCLRILSSFELLNPNNEELLMLKAEAYSQRGKIDKAIAIFEFLLDQETQFDSSILYVQLAGLYDRKSNTLEAIDSWKNAIDLDATLEMAHVSLRYAFIKADIPEEGIRYFKNLTDERPYSAAAWVELAECYSHIEEYDKAVSAFDFALVIEEGHIIAMVGKGSALFQKEEFAKALHVFLELERIIDEDPSVICSIGECYEQLEEYVPADVYFLKALSIDPEHCEARLGHAIVSEQNGDWNKALKQMETVVGLEPDNGEYWFIYAELLSRYDKFDKGQLSYERAIQLCDDQLEFHMGQIDSLIRAEELSKALDKVQMAFESFGDLKTIYLRGIRVLFEIGQKEEGLVLLEMLLDRHKDSNVLREYYPDIFEDSEALHLLKFQ